MSTPGIKERIGTVGNQVCVCHVHAFGECMQVKVGRFRGDGSRDRHFLQKFSLDHVRARTHMLFAARRASGAQEEEIRLVLTECTGYALARTNSSPSR